MRSAQRCFSWRETRANPYPGKSTNLTPSTSKKLIFAVLPGTLETRASCFLPISLFKREDLPTFERPTKATSGGSGEGSCEIAPYDASYRAVSYLRPMMPPIALQKRKVLF